MADERISGFKPEEGSQSQLKPSEEEVAGVQGNLPENSREVKATVEDNVQADNEAQSEVKQLSIEELKTLKESLNSALLSIDSTLNLMSTGLGSVESVLGIGALEYIGTLQGLADYFETAYAGNNELGRQYNNLLDAIAQLTEVLQQLQANGIGEHLEQDEFKEYIDIQHIVARIQPDLGGISGSLMNVDEIIQKPRSMWKDDLRLVVGSGSRFVANLKSALADLKSFYSPEHMGQLFDQIDQKIKELEQQKETNSGFEEVIGRGRDRIEKTLKSTS